MNSSEFKQIADETLNDLSQFLEKADTDYNLEIDLLDGILNIELPDGSKYVINKHNVSMQIWLSSPVSGASHFSYDNGKWISSDGRDFMTFIKNELKPFIQI